MESNCVSVCWNTFKQWRLYCLQIFHSIMEFTDSASHRVEKDCRKLRDGLFFLLLYNQNVEYVLSVCSADQSMSVVENFWLCVCVASIKNKVFRLVLECSNNCSKSVWSLSVVDLKLFKQAVDLLFATSAEYNKSLWNTDCVCVTNVHVCALY